MKILNAIVLGVLMTTTLSAQDFTDLQKKQGYAIVGEDVVFLFDEEIYELKPEKVVATGAFRSWSQDMEDETFFLEKGKNGLWTLKMTNADFKNIAPHTPFKFRTDDGKWLNPPAVAPNEKGGNLIFMIDFIAPKITAELRRPRTIWVKTEGMERSFNSADYQITDAKGRVIKVVSALPNTASEMLLTPAEPLDLKRVYYLEIPTMNLKTPCSYDGWFRETYSEKPLGANIIKNKKGETITTFRIFAPRATAMNLYFYKKHNDTKAYFQTAMQEDADGVWEYEAGENLKGVYYDFTVHGANEIGNLFYDTHPAHISDPYARVNAEAQGKSRVWEATKPATPLKNGIPKMEDIIAYEVHVQDFTDQLPVDKTLKGTLPAMTVRGLKNSKGQKIGFDYLLGLGVNVLHLMPIQEYLHFPDEDWKASFKDDEYMIEQGISEENYQWGYRTTHAFAVENKYRKKDTDFGAERDQFRDLVQAFHDEGIAVIIDIVPNHTGENMDGKDELFHFNALDKQYYYRTKDFQHIGEYGNEVKTENRPMVQRWLIDQCLHYIEEFGIDGFRIDLAGQIDRQTLIALKKAIGEDKILYGEPWIASNDPNFEANPDWDWYKENSPITFFQDESRNAFKGPVFELNSKENDRGWPGGKSNERENVMKGLANAFSDDKTPLSGISYLDIHDNFALADQFGTTDFDGRFGVDEDRYKIATTLLYTTLGPLVTHGGTEMMRSKGFAPLREEKRVTKAGFSAYMHGKRDTYNHRIANQFVWENVGKTKKDKDSYCNYDEMLAFWSGMNAFRLSEYGAVFRIAEKPADDYYQWITPKDDRALGYIVDGKILVLLNTSEEAFTFVIDDLPKGDWKLIGNNNGINHVDGVKDKKKFTNLKGGKSHQIEVPALGLKIWVL